LLPSESSRTAAVQQTALAGTPQYMAPEQLEKVTGQIGPATDVYGLGTILYEVLAGRPVFLNDRNAKLEQLVANQPAIPLRLLRKDIPRDLDAICLKCLVKNPAGRYSSAETLKLDLKAFLEGQVVRARRVGAHEILLKWIRRHPLIAVFLVLL